MPPPALPVTTIRYLYATTWLPFTDREDIHHAVISDCLLAVDDAHTTLPD
jgi:hypothetical protein